MGEPLALIPRPDRQLLFEAAPVLIMVIAPDAPRFTLMDATDAYLHATMRDRDRFIGRPLFDVFPDNPDDPTADGTANLEASLERAIATGQPDAMPEQRYDVTRPDGSFEERWWSPTNAPFLDESGRVTAVIHHAIDITEERRAQQAQRRTEALYQQIVEGAEDFAIVMLDDSGTIISWNTGAERVVGYTAAEAIGQPGEIRFTSEDVAAGVPTAELNQARSNGRAIDERWHKRKDGSRFWSSGLIMRIDREGGGFLKMYRDRTTEHEAEASMLENEALLRKLNERLEGQVQERTAQLRLYRDIIASTVAPVVAFDCNMRVTAFNEAHAEGFFRVFGHQPAIGEVLPKLFPPDQAKVLTELMTRALSGEVFTVIEAFGNPLRAQPYFEVHYAPLRDEGGHIVGAFHYAQDITGRLKAEAELAAARDALRQSQKMEAMGQSTGGVAHDFNNLLTPILGSLDMLMRRGLGNERERRLIDGALQSADRAKTLVQRLLAFARRQPLQPVPVDLAALIDGMAGLIESTIGPTITLRTDLAENLPPASADPNQLEMAILNLCVNARDAMPGGGTLTIEARRDAVHGQHPSGLQDGHYVLLSVTDTGTGMDKTTLARAIEPFYSTKGIGKGTGLGLSMVHGLAAQLGGGLTIDSKLGCGTAIALWLPVSLLALGAENDTRSASEIPKSRGRILLVDDEELVRMSTSDMLTDMGFEVCEADSAEHALALLKADTAVDLIITDHLMPGMSGAEMVHEVRAMHPTLPILIVSGYAEVEGIAPDLPRLTKPFRQGELAEKLREFNGI